jgi:hypothetical protein
MAKKNEIPQALFDRIAANAEEARKRSESVARTADNTPSGDQEGIAGVDFAQRAERERLGQQESLTRLSNQVLESLGGDSRETTFRNVFGDVAHKNGIFHSKNPGQYNYFYREVRKRVLKRLAGAPKDQRDLF